MIGDHTWGRRNFFPDEGINSCQGSGSIDLIGRVYHSCCAASRLHPLHQEEVVASLTFYLHIRHWKDEELIAQ